MWIPFLLSKVAFWDTTCLFFGAMVTKRHWAASNVAGAIRPIASDRACCARIDMAAVPSEDNIGQLDPGLVRLCTELGSFGLIRTVLSRILASVTYGEMGENAAARTHRAL